MDKNDLQEYRLDTVLTDFMPLPRGLLKMDLSPTAVLLYAVLLDRGTLSRKNTFANECGWVYVIYPVSELAKTLGVSDSQVQRLLNQLEKKRLLRRRRPVGNSVSHLFLTVPGASVMESPTEQPCVPGQVQKPARTSQKVHTNKLREQTEENKAYYQYGEEESL